MKKLFISATFVCALWASTAFAGGTGLHQTINPEVAGAVSATSFPTTCYLEADDVTNGRSIFIDCDEFFAVSGDSVTGATTFASSITVSGEAILTGEVNLGAVTTFTDSDATPSVAGAAYFNTNTATVTITDFDGAGLSAGDVIIVVSKGAITFDVTSSGILGGTTDIITAAGDVTTFLYDGTDWLVVARMDMSDNLN